MALVAYDASSSENESEEEEEDTSNKVILNPKEVQQNNTSNAISNTNSNITTDNNADLNMIFTALPTPKDNKAPVVEEEDDEFLRKKEIPDSVPKPKKTRQPVKIGVPALSQYESDDEDEPLEKKLKPTVKGSGLFSVLPAPKNVPVTTKSFIPNVLTKKTNSKPLVPTSVKKPSAASNKSPAVKSTSDLKTSNVAKVSTKTDDAINTDDSDVDDIEVPETFDDEMWQKVCGQRQKPVPRNYYMSETSSSSLSLDPEEHTPTQPIVEIAPEPVKPYSGLDNEGFKQLVGKMRKHENIQVIDIHEDDIVPDKDTWMIKALTDPAQEPKHVVKDPVNDTCKRKHHITYLAQQAKANEQELQNTWSANRFTRKQTQSKYGF